VVLSSPSPGLLVGVFPRRSWSLSLFPELRKRFPRGGSLVRVSLGPPLLYFIWMGDGLLAFSFFLGSHCSAQRVFREPYRTPPPPLTIPWALPHPDFPFLFSLPWPRLPPLSFNPSLYLTAQIRHFFPTFTLLCPA